MPSDHMQHCCRASLQPWPVQKSPLPAAASQARRHRRARHHTIMAATPLLAFDRLASQPATADPAAAPALIAVLHGIAGSSSQYAPFVQHLVDAAAASAGRPVEALVINLRGHGGSRDLPLPPPHTMEAAREDVLALLR